MSNARNLLSTTDNQTVELSTLSSSSTSAMTSSLSSCVEPETQEEKKANDEMPSPLHNIILDYAGYKLSNMTAGSSSLFHSIKKAKTKELITAIVSGDLITVATMINEYPLLLLERLEEKDSITSLSGQKSNNVTPYRTALAVEDTQMAALIKSKMVELYAGHAADQQYHEQFPAGWEAAEEKRWAPVFEQLKTLTQAIRGANLEEKDISSSERTHYRSGVRKNSAVAIALAEFRKRLNTLLNETVTTGRHYNPNLLLEAYKIYEQHYAKHFGNDWSNPRALLFWQQVIGTIQRGLPVNYVQAFCDGLYNTEENLRNNTPQGRSLTIVLFDTSRRMWRTTAFYPLADSRLGFEWAAGTWSGLLGWTPGYFLAVSGAHVYPSAFRSLCQSKTAGMQTLMHQQDVREPSTSCVVM